MEDATFTSDWWAAFLGLNCQFEVAVQDLDVDRSFAEDPRLEHAETVSTFVWEPPSQDDDELFSVSCVAGAGDNHSSSSESFVHSVLRVDGDVPCVQGCLHKVPHPVPFQVCILTADFVPLNRWARELARVATSMPKLVHPVGGTAALSQAARSALHLAGSKAGSCRALAGPFVPSCHRLDFAHLDALSQPVRLGGCTASSFCHVDLANLDAQSQPCGRMEQSLSPIDCVHLAALSPPVHPASSTAQSFLSVDSPCPDAPLQRRCSVGCTTPSLPAVDFTHLDARSQPVHLVGSTAQSFSPLDSAYLAGSKEGSCRALAGPLGFPGPVAVPAEPPSLLCRPGPPRPSDISKMCAGRVDVLPEHLARYPVNEIPLDQLGLFALEPSNPRRQLRFSVFDRQRHHVHRTAAYGWSLQDLVAEAVRTAGERIRCVQIIANHMPDLMVPQLVLTPEAALPNHHCVPLDMRAFGGRPCTLLLQPGMSTHDVIREVVAHCPGGPLFIPPSPDQGYFLVDAQGGVWDELPADLTQLQWLRLCNNQHGIATGMAMDFDMEPPQPAASTTTTATWTQGHDRVEFVSFVLAGLGITVRLHPQHIAQARVSDSIADLIMSIARQRQLPTRSRVVLAAAQPIPIAPQHITIIFTLYPDDTRRHLILDPSADGSMAQGISVDDNAWPDELLGPAQARQGFVIAVNGVTQAAVRRVLHNGDYAQVVRMPQMHRVTPTDWHYQLFPELRLFAFPIEVPRLQRATAAPLDTLVQTQVRDSFLRYLRERLAHRDRVMGRPAADTQAIIVQGPNHAPAMLYVPGRISPVLSEVEESISHTGLFLIGTTFADSCELTHQHMPLFLSIPPGTQNIGMFVPAPTFFFGYYQVWLPPGVSPATLDLPVRRGFVLDYPAVVRPAAAITQRRASAPTREQRRAALYGGTSMVQIPNYAAKQDKRCHEYLRVHDMQEECSCSNGHVVCREVNEPSHDLQPIGALMPARAAHAMVPTPFGRRSLPRSPAVGASALVACTRPWLEPLPVPAPDPMLECTTEQPKRCARQTLALQDLLPGHDHQQEARLCFATPSDNLRHALAPFRLDALCRDMLPASHLHPAAAEMLAHLPPRNVELDAEAVMLFVDGSFEHAVATWAVAVLVCQQGQWRWAGYQADAVPSALSPSSAYDGELFGQFVAHGIVASTEAPSVIFFDSTSASLVATAQASTCAHTALGRAVASLHFLCHVEGCPPVAQYVKSHSGHPGNELADSIAKAILKGRLAPAPLSDEHVVSYILQGDFDTLWIHRAHNQRGTWPQFDDHGEALPIVPWPQHSNVDTPAQWAFDSQAGTARLCRLKGQIATYNTLSAVSPLQRQCLSAFMRRHGILFAGFQECRQASAGPVVQDGVLRLSSPSPEGRGGCQLWADLHALPGGNMQQFSVHYRHPRLLVVLYQTGGLRIALVVGHAPDSTTPEEERAAWWELRLHSLPPNTAPILLLDANARYRAVQAEETAEVPTNANAHAFDALLQQYQLHRTPACDANRLPYPTWRSPQGVWACLDYLAVPAIWRDGFQPLGVQPILDTHAGIDHQPVLAKISVTLSVPEPPKCRLNVDLMRSPAGVARIRETMRSLPDCPWHMDVDDHLAAINNHIHQCIRDHFLKPTTSARKPGVSAFTMELLRAKRQCRRRHHRREDLHRRRLMAVCLQAWRDAGPGHQAAPRCRPPDIQAHDRLCAEHIADMQRLCRHLRRSFKHDEAEYARDMYQQARQAGPVQLARVLRSVLRVGRSYKPPRIAQGIEGPNGLETDPHVIKQLFGDHFAAIEAAQPCQLRDLRQECVPAAGVQLLADGLPTPVALASAFAGLQHNKAPGLSSIPAEFYNACPIESAAVHLPLLHKMTTRGKCPLLWRGLLAVPLPKPNKPSHQVTGYRSIALQEPAAKAVSKSMRPALVTGFQEVCLDSVGGARPDIATDFPASGVQLHLRALKRQGLSGSVVFVDGVSAFYAVRRELLFTDNLQTVLDRVQGLPVEAEVRQRFVQGLKQHGALASAKIPEAVQRLLKTTLGATWFTTAPANSVAQHTSAGTIPGAPLADLLFQFCLDLVLHALADHLEAEDIQARIFHDGAQLCSAAPLSWLDDLAILLQAKSSDRAATDASRATALVGQYLSIVGIQLNTQAGKTEAIVVWHGPGSQAARYETMICQGATVPLVLPSGETGRLRCVLNYVHLGTRREADGDLRSALDHRHCEARSVYKAVKQRLLTNQFLTLAERQALFASLVISRFMHGSGTWLFTTHGLQQRYHSLYMGLLRGAVRPLYGFSCTRLDADEVCTLMRAMMPEEALAQSRVRVLAGLGRHGGRYLQAQCAADPEWVTALRSDVSFIAKVLADESLQNYAAMLPGSNFEWIKSWPWSKEHTRAKLAAFRHAAIRSRQGWHAQVCHKAKAHNRVLELGACFYRLADPLPEHRIHPCPECKAMFLTKAAAAAHRAACHDIRSDAAFAVGTACEVSRRQFWDTKRLSQHFRSSPRCAAVYREADLQPTHREVLADKRMPPHVLVGPAPWWSTMTHEPSTPPDPTPNAVNYLQDLLALQVEHQVPLFFRMLACSVESQGRDVVLDAIQSVQGSDEWLLVVQVASVLGQDCELHVFTAGQSMAAFQAGNLLLGPAAAVRELLAEGWRYL